MFSVEVCRWLLAGVRPSGYNNHVPDFCVGVIGIPAVGAVCCQSRRPEPARGVRHWSGTLQQGTHNYLTCVLLVVRVRNRRRAPPSVCGINGTPVAGRVCRSRVLWEEVRILLKHCHAGCLRRPPQHRAPLCRRWFSSSFGSGIVDGRSGWSARRNSSCASVSVNGFVSLSDGSDAVSGISALPRNVRRMGGEIAVWFVRPRRRAGDGHGDELLWGAWVSRMRSADETASRPIKT